MCAAVQCCGKIGQTLIEFSNAGRISPQSLFTYKESLGEVFRSLDVNKNTF
jgi:hypothetical protein